MGTSSGRIVGVFGTIAAVVGALWLVVLSDLGHDEWLFVAAVMLLGGLLLRIEAAVRARGRVTPDCPTKPSSTHHT